MRVPLFWQVLPVHLLILSFFLLPACDCQKEWSNILFVIARLVILRLQASCNGPERELKDRVAHASGVSTVRVWNLEETLEVRLLLPSQ